METQLILVKRTHGNWLGPSTGRSREAEIRAAPSSFRPIYQCSTTQLMDDGTPLTLRAVTGHQELTRYRPQSQVPFPAPRAGRSQLTESTWLG